MKLGKSKVGIDGKERPRGYSCRRTGSWKLEASTIAPPLCSAPRCAPWCTSNDLHLGRPKAWSPGQCSRFRDQGIIQIYHEHTASPLSSLPLARPPALPRTRCPPDPSHTPPRAESECERICAHTPPSPSHWTRSHPSLLYSSALHLTQAAHRPRRTVGLSAVVSGSHCGLTCFRLSLPLPPSSAGPSRCHLCRLQRISRFLTSSPPFQSLLLMPVALLTSHPHPAITTIITTAHSNTSRIQGSLHLHLQLDSLRLYCASSIQRHYHCSARHYTCANLAPIATSSPAGR